MHPAINGKDNCISIAIYCNRNLTEHIPKYSSVRDMNQPPTPQKQLTQKKKVTETASTTILFRRLHSFGLDSYLKKHSLNEELMIAIWNKHSRLKLTSRQIQHSSWPESGRHLWFPSSRLSKHTLQTSQWNDLSWWILEDKKLSVDTITKHYGNTYAYIYYWYERANQKRIFDKSGPFRRSPEHSFFTPQPLCQDLWHWTRCSLNKLNDFALFRYFLVFWSNFYAGRLMDRGVKRGV